MKCVLLKLSEKDHYYVAYNFSAFYWIWNLIFLTLSSFELNFFLLYMGSVLELGFPALPRACTFMCALTHLHTYSQMRLQTHEYADARTHWFMHWQLCAHSPALTFSCTHNCAEVTLTHIHTRTRSLKFACLCIHEHNRTHSLILACLHMHAFVSTHKIAHACTITLALTRTCTHTHLHMNMKIVFSVSYVLCLWYI